MNKQKTESDKIIAEYDTSESFDKFALYEEAFEDYVLLIEKFNSGYSMALTDPQKVTVTEYSWKNLMNSDELVTDETVTLSLADETWTLTMDYHEEKESNGLLITDISAKLEGDDTLNDEGIIQLTGYYTKESTIGDRSYFSSTQTYDPRAIVSFDKGLAKVKIVAYREGTDKIHTSHEYVLEPVFEEI